MMIFGYYLRISIKSVLIFIFQALLTHTFRLSNLNNSDQLRLLKSNLIIFHSERITKFQKIKAFLHNCKAAIVRSADLDWVRKLTPTRDWDPFF